MYFGGVKYMYNIFFIGIKMPEDKDFYANSKYVKILTPKDFEEKEPWKLKSKENTAVIYSVKWCPHCVRAKPEWEKFAEMNKDITVASFDCEKYEKHTARIRKMVETFPTIIFYKNGEPRHKYEGARTVAKLLDASNKVYKNK